VAARDRGHPSEAMSARRVYIERPEHGPRSLVLVFGARALYLQVECNWLALWNWREYNWIDIQLIHIGYEWKRYAGSYHEAWVRLLGFGLWATLCDGHKDA
jgi:hypothetical protein